MHNGHGEDQSQIPFASVKTGTTKSINFNHGAIHFPTMDAFKEIFLIFLKLSIHLPDHGKTENRIVSPIEGYCKVKLISNSVYSHKDNDSGPLQHPN